MSADKTVILNGAAAFVARCITVAISFITVPYAIHALGIRGYGVWEAIFAVSVLSNALLSSLSGGLLWKMSRAYGTKDHGEIKRLITVGSGAVLCIFAFSVPVIYILRRAIIHALNIPTQFAAEATALVTFVCALLILSGFCDILAAAIAASQRAGLANMLQACGLAANGVIMIVGLQRGWRLHSFVIGQAVGFVVTLVVLSSALIRIYGFFLPQPGLPRKQDLRALLPYCGFLLIGSISIALRGQTDKLLLSRYAGPLWVGFYGIAIRLASPILMICGFFYIPLISASAALHAKSDMQGIYKLCNTMTALVAFLSGSMVVFIASFYEKLVYLWLGKSVPEVGLMLYFLLGGNLIAVLLTGIGSSLCKGLGRPGIEASYITLAIVLNIVMKFAFMHMVGPIGTVIASAVSWSIASGVFVITFHTKLKIPWAPTIRAMASFAGVVVTVLLTRAIASGVISSNAFSSHALVLPIAGLFAILLYSAFSFAIWRLPMKPKLKGIFQTP